MSATGHEDEFRRLFEEEAMSRLTVLAEHALELEARGPDPELVSSMFRHAHTLKGGAGVVGFDLVGDAVHELEQLLEDLRERRLLSAAGVPDAVLGAVDGLREMVACAMAGEDQGPAMAAVRAALRRAGATRPASDQRADEPEWEHPAELVATPARGGALGRPTPAGGADDRESIPVPVRRLDELVRLVGEGAAAQLRVGRLLAERLGDEPGVLDEYRELARVLQELQEKAMRARMVSVGGVAAPLRRAVRDIARASGKEVRWAIAGEETELDRHVLERLRDPLVALVRNAVDHGIEAPAERVAAGKDPAGLVRVHAMQIGSDVIISVADDGRGVDLDEVRAAASAPGRRPLTDAEALAAIFDPGVSTAPELTGISGRGVGLDAVRAAVDDLRGRVEVHSRLGEGTEFRISVPMTLAILRCVLVVTAGHCYAIPMIAAVALLAPATADAGLTAEGRPAVWVGPDAVPLSDLGTLLGIADGGPPSEGPVLVLSTPAGRQAFRVDAVRGQRDVVVKDLGRLLPRLDLLAGASVEPDGTIMLVLDPNGLIEAAAGESGLAAAALARARTAAELPATRVRARARVLVVDDALTIRELQRSILERAGYEVVVASDGRDALARLAEAGADLVLTDIEMPVMDGFELTQAIRANPATSAVPVLILTSRTDETDRRRGLDSGADGYLVKSTFDEHSLLTAVARLLGEPAGEEPTP